MSSHRRHTYEITVFLVLWGMTVGLIYGCTEAKSVDGWESTSPAAADFHPDITDRLDEAVRDGELHNLHAVVVVRRGKLVFDRYYEGTDERWTVPLGTVKFSPDVKHDLRSSSKSIVGLLYGIALGEGKVPGPDESLLEQFPAYKDLASDPKRRQIKVHHALSMTLGSDCPEELPYTDPRNAEVAMYAAHDPYYYVLSLPMVADPGSRWDYCGGTTAVLGHLIARGSGMILLEYARQKLFDPLGIADVEWVGGSHGEVSAASGLRLRPRDLAKIGQLVLDQGRWGDQQVVPADWLEQSFMPHGLPPAMSDEAEFAYGYQWGIARQKSDGQLRLFAPGNGGQRLIVIPDLDLVVVIMAGNYNDSDQEKVPNTVLNDIVIPAVN